MNEPHGYQYHVLREDLASDLRAGIAPHRLDGFVEHIRENANLTRGEAVQMAERFYADLRRELARRG